MPLITYKEQIKIKKILACERDLFTEIDGMKRLMWFQFWKKKEWVKRKQKCVDLLSDVLKEAGLNENEYNAKKICR